MTERTKPLVGEVVKTAGRAVTPADGLSALLQLADTTQKVIVTLAAESSKRERLRVYEVTEVGRIKAAEAALRDYFDRAFAERRSVYEEMFARLDRALDEQGNEALHSVVVGIVDLAKSSPLSNVGDLSQLRAALDDPNQIWDL